jgi:hypothetical protein
MQRNTRFFAAAMLTAFMGTTLFAPIAASASEEGKRNTTIGLGALAAGLLLTQKNKLPGLLAAGGTVYAYSQYQNDINKRHRRERAAAYHNGYRRGASYARNHRRRR